MSVAQDKLNNDLRSSQNNIGCSAGKDSYSPYAAMGNQPESSVDPNGLIPTRMTPGGTQFETYRNIDPTAGGFGSDWGMYGGAGSNYSGGGDEIWNDLCNFGGSTASRAAAAFAKQEKINSFNATLEGTELQIGDDESWQDSRDPAPQSGGKNESTQAGVLFFKNEGDAYKYMLSNSTKDIEKDGESKRPIENFAYVTKEGVYVLPTAGQDIDGENYRNYANEAEWRVLDYKVGTNGMSIKYNGKWQNVLAAVHTHPYTGPGNVPSHSSADRGWINDKHTLGIVLAFNGQAYGMIPGVKNVINFSTNADLMNGRVSIIKQYSLLMKFFKSNN